MHIVMHIVMHVYFTDVQVVHTYTKLATFTPIDAGKYYKYFLNIYKWLTLSVMIPKNTSFLLLLMLRPINDHTLHVHYTHTRTKCLPIIHQSNKISIIPSPSKSSCRKCTIGIAIKYQSCFAHHYCM